MWHDGPLLESEFLSTVLLPGIFGRKETTPTVISLLGKNFGLGKGKREQFVRNLNRVVQRWIALFTG